MLWYWQDMKPEFTVADAIKIQQEHLKQWQEILKPEFFAKLKVWAEATNATETNPYEIRRGSTLDGFIHNQGRYL